jgi:hypothetical protein
VTIRSYRRVFKIHRRIYRVDRWALPVPGGVSLLSIGYFAAAIFTVAILSKIPIVDDGVGLLNAPLRWVIIPIAIAVLCSQATPDGRPMHKFAICWLRMQWKPTVTTPVVGGKLRTRWDIDAPMLRKLRVHGPARVRFSVPVALGGRGGRVVAQAGDTDNATVVLCGDGELEVRP